MTANARACIVLLVGPPGSGKSEWTRRNADGAVIVSQDDLIDAITPAGFEAVCRPIYAAAEEAIAHAGLNAGYPVIVDRTNRTRTLRRRWIEVAAAHRCPIVAVEMTASPDLCRARNLARTNHRRVEENRMERMLRVLQPPTMAEGFAAIFRDDAADLVSILEQLHLSATDPLWLAATQDRLDAGC